jgi:hypothetical protein
MVKKADMDAYLEAHRHEPLDLEALADLAIRELRGQP